MGWDEFLMQDPSSIKTSHTDQKEWRTAQWKRKERWEMDRRPDRQLHGQIAEQKDAKGGKASHCDSLVACHQVTDGRIRSSPLTRLQNVKHGRYKCILVVDRCTSAHVWRIDNNVMHLFVFIFTNYSWIIINNAVAVNNFKKFGWNI